MSLTSSNANTKTDMLAVIGGINRVDGFDPTPFVMDFNDLSTGETRKRLPVITQIAWFRLKYPDGKITVQVVPSKDCFVATARVYPSYRDSAECFLAEATASRGYSSEKPSVSPREWAQTAAIGIALRNAGFGLQFEMVGEDFDAIAPNEYEDAPHTQTDSLTEIPTEDYIAEVPVQRKLTEEEQLEQAMQMPCPITKYSGKTLGEVMGLDPKALVWIATKYTGDENIKAAALLICEYSRNPTSA